MDGKARESIERVILHCDMFLYGNTGSADTFLNPIARRFYDFAGIHLMSTMFLIQDSQHNPKPMGGFCYRVLEPLGFAYLLEGIQQILQTPLGQTTLGDYIRRCRNKLATHGDLSAARMPEKELSFLHYDNAEVDHERLMDELQREVQKLRSKLEELLSQKPF